MIEKYDRPCYEPEKCMTLFCEECEFRTANHDEDCWCDDCDRRNVMEYLKKTVPINESGDKCDGIGCMICDNAKHPNEFLTKIL